MPELTEVTLTVPLRLPLALVNAIEAEALRSNTSIPDMLSCMLVDTFERQDFDADNITAAELLSDPTPFSHRPSLDALSIQAPAP